MTVRADLDAAIELYHRAAEAFVRGDCEPYKAVFSHRDDVTLANPFGPIRQGWQEAATAMERATALYEEGEITGVENLQTYVTPELAYIIEIERIRTKMGGRSEPTDVVLRTTSILRPEYGAWRVVHRHADPIVTERGAESVIDREA